MKGTLKMCRQWLSFSLKVFIIVFYVPSSLAQAGDDHSDHAQHVVAEPVAEEAATANGDTESIHAMDHENMDHENMGHENMDHENMNMNMDMEQAAPTTPGRSPHEYSNGYEREQGPYALPLSDQVSMADEESFSRFLFNRFEQVDKNEGDATRFDVQLWYGPTFNHFVLKTEGELDGSSLEESKSELLWSVAASKFWDAQFGVRIDNGNGPSRSWLAAGIQGLAPYWFDVHATAFLGENGRSAFGFEAEYEARLTQRLMLKPRVDFNFYGKSDAEKGIGSGLSNGIVGLRLQYQFDRQFAPYFGVEREVKFGETAEFARAGLKTRTRETRWVAGVRFWF